MVCFQSSNANYATSHLSHIDLNWTDPCDKFSWSEIHPAQHCLATKSGYFSDSNLAPLEQFKCSASNTVPLSDYSKLLYCRSILKERASVSVEKAVWYRKNCIWGAVHGQNWDGFYMDSSHRVFSGLEPWMRDLQWPGERLNRPACSRIQRWFVLIHTGGRVTCCTASWLPILFTTHLKFAHPKEPLFSSLDEDERLWFPSFGS